jgi:uncharacterized protein (DUF1778 family)
MKTANLMLRMDQTSKKVLTRAATLRGVTTSDYVRQVVLTQARQELEEARTRTISLSADEQRAFWEALHAPVRLTKAQRQLSRVMRGH